jgi:hypothetical protein
MGFSVGWVATRGVEPDRLYAALGLRPTGVSKPLFDADAMGGGIPGGWHCVVKHRYERVTADALLADLSRGGEAVACFVEEHVMYSKAVGWRAGAKSWSVIHDSQQAHTHLEIAGDLPPTFEAVRAACEASQREADADEPEVDHLFDIPVGLAQAITGFRHDAVNDGLELEVLEPARSQWLARWFRR